MIRNLPFAVLGTLGLLLAACSSRVAAPQPTSAQPVAVQDSTPGTLTVQALPVPGSFVSTIYSASTTSCLDVPGGSKDVNQQVLGFACNSSAEQTFTFTPLPNRAGAYTVMNTASTLFMTQYRFGVRQNTFSDSVSPWYGVWTLRPVNVAAHQYLLEPTLYTDPALNQPAYQRCVTAYPAVPGTAHPYLSLGNYCNPASGAQLFRIAGAP